MTKKKLEMNKNWGNRAKKIKTENQVIKAPKKNK